MDLHASIQRIDHIDPRTAVVAISGALRMSDDLKTVNNTLQQLIVDGITRIILDLGACPFVDSAGLGTLIHTYGLLSERNGSLRLAAANDRISALIHMTHTQTMLPIDPTPTQALEHLT